jgi:DNA polymerase III sliding clamp (beta) subunit (PCNA family)
MTIIAQIKAGVLKEYLSRAENLVDELKLVATPSGFSFKIVDPAHVAMCISTLDAKAFNTLSVDMPEPVMPLPGEKAPAPKGTEIFFDIERLFGNVWRNTKPTDIIRIHAPKEEEKHSCIEIEYNEIVKQVLINPNDMEGYSDAKWPDLNLSNKLSIRTSDLRAFINSILDYTDHVRFRCVKSGLIADICSAHDGGIVKIRKLFREEALQGYSFTKETTTLISLSYLTSMLKALGKTHWLTIEFGHDYPIRISWDQVLGQDIIGKGVYLLAPRIEND